MEMAGPRDCKLEMAGPRDCGKWRWLRDSAEGMWKVETA